MPEPRTDEQQRLDDELDDQLEDSFPASDPPSITQPHDPDGEPEADEDA